MVKIIQGEVRTLTDYIYKISGIALDQSKVYLLETRLGALLDEYGCASYSEFHQKAIVDKGRTLERKIIDAITTNETLFFRDTSPFELLQHKIIPDLIDRRCAKSSGLSPMPLRIWSAACSTGQEIYSVAIVLKELLPDLKRYNLKLLGTDISDAAIAQASYGHYNKFEIERGLPEDKLTKYFHPNGNHWKIKDELRAMVVFKKMNLMLPFDEPGKFDVILCRNVAIYFSLEDRKKLFNKIAGILEQDGSLLIGATESLTGVCSRFQPQRHLKTIYYQLAG